MTRMTARVKVEGGRLLFDGVDVAGLAGRVDTPFFLYSQARIAANVARLRRAFESRHASSRVFFASKACSNLWFLEQIRAAGAGARSTPAASSGRRCAPASHRTSSCSTASPRAGRRSRRR